MLEFLRKLLAPTVRGRVEFELNQAQFELLDAEHQAEHHNSRVDMLKKRIVRLETLRHVR